MSLQRAVASLSSLAAFGVLALSASCSSTDDPGAGGSQAMVGGASGIGGASGGAGPQGGSTTGGSAGSGAGVGAGTGGGAGVPGGSTGVGGVGSGGLPPGGAAGVGGATGGLGGTAGVAAGAGDGGTGGMKPPSTLIGDVAFSTPSQTFRDQLMVGMTTAVAGAEIRYTTDGTLPTASSTLYPGAPITVTATTQVRAQPFTAGASGGLVSTAIYIARTFDFSSDLPIVVVDGYGKGKPEDKDVSLDAGVMFFEPTGGMASLSNLPTVATRAGYHVRGQSSASFPQTPYKVELWDNANMDADYPVLGMPSDADWALIPPYYDRSLVRNPFIYTLGKDMGMQAPRTAYAEVYLNYANRPLADTDYQGIYWISETIKNAEVRTNLKQLRETDTTLPAISGGYIFKFDQAAAEEPKLTCTGANPIAGGFGMQQRGMQGGAGTTGTAATCWVDLEVIDPDPLNAEQKTWLTDYVQQFHNSLHTTPIGNYAQFIDVPSFVDNLIINELSRNVDAYVRSSYYHKNRDGLLMGGPLWDYNFALAVGGSGTIDPMGGWQFEGTRNVNNWYPKLTQDPAFMAQVKTRWAALRQNLYSQASLDQRITMLAAPLTNAVVRDFAKWPVSSVYPTLTGFVRGPTVPTWAEQIQALRTFVTARVAWMDSQLQ